jgi:hypothetical protein
MIRDWTGNAGSIDLERIENEGVCLTCSLMHLSDMLPQISLE